MRGWFVVHAEDAHSNKSALIPPPLIELESLARQVRQLQPEAAPAGDRGGATRALRRRLDPQTINELVARYTAGEGSGDLSTEIGISKSGLLRLLRTEGVNLRKQPMTPRNANRAAWLYESGLTITEVVEQIGYFYSTVRKSLNESGVAMRPKGIKRSSLGRR